MTVKQFFLLLIPSALWGSSFIFMKELSPIFGPVLTSTLRIVSASIFLFALFGIQKYKVEWKRDWKLFTIIGLGNSALPFVLYSYAALHLPSSLSVILNSTSPMFGALFGYLLLKDRLTWNKYLGVILGSTGVAIVTSVVFIEPSTELYLSIVSCVGAAALYGLSGAYVKKYALHIEPKQLTIGSLTTAGIFLVLIYLFLEIIGTNPSIVSENIFIDIILVIIFGILCTSIPYIIYYKLLQEIGPIKALAVTYLMPIFGIVWSLIYGEAFVFTSVIGLLVILVGIYVLSLKKE